MTWNCWPETALFVGAMMAVGSTFALIGSGVVADRAYDAVGIAMGAVVGTLAAVPVSLYVIARCI